jgi:aspartate carbamoyltransferase regulatory subunit
VVSVPDEITAIAKCMNPKCIGNHEDITTRFDVIQKKPIQLKCLYCEKITDQHHLEII